ncbi:MAG: DUF4418 family protein [Treponema sp.]|jgi:hypothetical protein|nr:DUF4418 family protein [Treponema sp.]
MKERLFTGIPFVLAGLLIAFGPITIFPVCAITHDMIMKCHWTARAEHGVGLVIAALGLLTVLVKLPAFRLGLSAAVILSAVTALLLPTVLIGVCSSHNMACRILTLPALTVISTLTIIGAAVNSGLLVKKIKKGETE